MSHISDKIKKNRTLYITLPISIIVFFTMIFLLYCVNQENIELTESNKEYIQTIDGLNLSLSEKEEEIREAQESLKELENNYNNLQKELSNYTDQQSQIDELTSNYNKLLEDYNALLSEYEQSQNEISNLNFQVATLESENDELSRASSQSSNEEYVESNNSGGIVYWVSSGEVYHCTPDCPTLKRSTNIHSGSIASSGKSRPCKVCY